MTTPLPHEAAIRLAKVDIGESEDVLAKACQQLRQLRREFPEVSREELIAMMALELHEKIKFEDCVLRLVVAIDLLAGRPKK